MGYATGMNAPISLTCSVGIPPELYTYILMESSRTGIAPHSIAESILGFLMATSVIAPPERLRALPSVKEESRRSTVSHRGSSQVALFLAEVVEESEGSEIRNSVFYDTYCWWAKRRGMPVLSHRLVTQAAEAAGLTHSKAAGRPWIGLRLRDDLAPHPA